MSSYDWRDLQFVLAVSEHGSLSTAAKALGVVPSTISRRLDALEASMGVELFHRQPSGYTLTKRGEYVIEALAPMPDLIKDWGRRVKSNTLEEITYVTLTAPSLVISRLNELLPAFFLAHPEIKLVLLDDNHVHDLQRSDADLAIIDPSIRRPLSASDLHLEDYSIWEGWPIHGWPVTTVMRGKIVVENGQFSGTLGRGQLISRKIDSDILNRPAC